MNSPRPEIKPPLSVVITEIFHEARQAKDHETIRLIEGFRVRALIEAIPLPDEEGILKVLGPQIVRVKANEVPSAIIKIKLAVADAMRDPYSHLKNTEKYWGEKVLEVRKKYPDRRAVERLIDSLQRGIKRRTEELTETVVILDRVEEDSDRCRTLGTIPETQLLRNFTLARNERQRNSISDLLNRLYSTVFRLEKEINKMLGEKTKLENVLNVIDGTTELLEELGLLPKSQPITTRSRIELSPASTPGPFPAPRKARPKFNLAQAEAELEKSDESINFFDLSLRKIQDAMNIANSTGVPLRILAPNEGKVLQRHRENWCCFLKELGFAGKIQFIGYEDVQRNPSHPTLIPGKMNTHQNLWDAEDDAEIFVLDISSPNLLRNHLRSNKPIVE